MDIESFLKKIAVEETVFKGIYKGLELRNFTIFNIGTDELVKKLAKFFRNKQISSNYNYETLKTMLSDDLNSFKNCFSNYLSEKLSCKKDYKKDQLELINRIFSSVKFIDISLKTQIINFNYTQIAHEKYEEVNIHGVLNSNIVIGYDSTDKEIRKDDVVYLSKDWQKLNVEFEYQFPLEGIKSIIIYGHSMGEQDYPYFFEIFDGCDFLSNKEVRLFVCYSLHGNSDNERRRNFENLQINCSKLLNAYERTRIGSSARNTIISKLKLQGRIKIVEV